MPLWDQLKPGQKWGLAGVSVAGLMAAGFIGERALARPDPGQMRIVPVQKGETKSQSLAPGPMPPFPESAPKLTTAEHQISLSTASAHDLKRIPGIGPELARALIQHREKFGPFRTEADVMAVPGIGPGRWKTMRPYSRP